VAEVLKRVIPEHRSRKSCKSARLIRNDDTQDRAVMQIGITAPPIITFLRARSYLNA